VTADRGWLNSRHLERDPRGTRALARLVALPEAQRTTILAAGDELARLSTALAHGFLFGAVALAEGSPEQLKDWMTGGHDLLGQDGLGRTCAQAYFDLDAVALCGSDPRSRHALVAAALQLEEGSKRLAAAFVTTFGRLLCSDPGFTASRLLAWQRAVSDCLRTARWRGEFLASRLVDSAAGIAAVLPESAVEDWATVLTAVETHARGRPAMAIPPTLGTLPPHLIVGTVRACARLTSSDPAAASRLLESLPSVLHALDAPMAERMLGILGPVVTEAGLADALGFVPAIVQELGADLFEELVVGFEQIANAFPAGAAAYLRSVDRAHEAGGTAGIRVWIERGIEIARGHPEAGIAHFRLQTRTAHKLLTHHSTAVGFDEIEPVLQRYVLMLARRPLQLVGGPGVWLRPPLAARQDAIVRLPERVDLFETSEENQLFYKLAVAHAAARWEYGTNTFDPRLLRTERVQSEVAMPPSGNDLLAFLEGFPNPLLAANLFIVLDGARLDAALSRDFPGLAAEIDQLGRAYARNASAHAERSGEALIDSLFLLSVGRVTPAELPAALRGWGRILAPLLARLRAADATVYDSARALQSLYGLLTLASARGGEETDGDALVEMGGAALADLLDYSAQEPGGTVASGASQHTDPDQPEESVDAERLVLELDGLDEKDGSAGPPLDPEELRRFLEQGGQLHLGEAHARELAGLGLYITDLLGKLPADDLERLRQLVATGDLPSLKAWLTDQRAGRYHYYDEWDYRIGDYRHRWCRLSELEVEGDGGRYYNGAITRFGDLIQRIKREFLMMRPEQFRKLRGMEDGEDLDLNAVVDAHADRRIRRTRGERLYVARRREERDVATLFLVDMSASTDEPLTEGVPGSPPRRVIDVTKDTLAVMATVLQEIGDSFAIYGFSGHGHENVDFYHIKSFNERPGPTVRARLGGISPKRSTRMGAALRHSAQKLAAVSARARHLIMLSDGFPQDHDYGDDRRSNVYGIRDTMMALQELEARAMRTFCITVDPAGHDYLREMCPSSRYAVIHDIAALPEELARIYRQVTRAR
jgi:Mg-chelatase subunit ChlD